ncbi:THUMP domain-containing protein 2 isoform X2 [Gadus morhua]|uniref:THUMP domain-containing protein 2 isoform X1 n=1 Tax=Gadus morhua TaxID=8049 RepID=UPI0011B3A52F|nr:THUMP domain-containing protein 2 isoform X1 [Gadus morhua]XP_030234565.1 THUMP domain-containing protein 2 isoform X2 [Gadus morhua]
MSIAIVLIHPIAGLMKTEYPANIEPLANFYPLLKLYFRFRCKQSKVRRGMAGSEPLQPLGLSRDLKGSKSLGPCRDLMGSEPLGPSRGLTEERRFFCTAGGGLEEVLVRELRTRLGAEEVCHVSGKVLFRTSAGMDALRRLKSAERLFLLVSRDGPVALPAHTCPVKAASLLQSRLLGDGRQWGDAALTWSRLQGETERRGSDGLQGATERRGSDGLQGEIERLGSDGLQGEIERCDSDVLRGAGPQRKTGGREEERGRRTQQGEEGSADGRRSERQAEGEEEEESSDGVNAEHKRGEKRKKGGGREVGGGGEEDRKIMRQKEHLSSPFPSEALSFRVNCKLSGPLSRSLNSQEASRVIGSGLSRLLGWRVELRSPQLEVSVYLSGDHSILGIPLTRLPLASRSYMRTTGLRSTVAWTLGSLAGIQPGWCVLDPMCGVGTILLEAAQDHKDVHFLGVDIDDGQLQRANENVAFADLRERIHLMKASCSGLPVCSSSVDAVVCDLPFGRKFNTKTNMADSLLCIVSEMERVLRPGGSLVLLLSPPMSCQLKKLQPGPRPGTQLPQAPGTQAPETQAPGTQPPQDPQDPGLQAGPLSSLRLQATHRLSLGAIDGLVHSYVKRGAL